MFNIHRNTLYSMRNSNNKNQMNIKSNITKHSKTLHIIQQRYTYTARD